ncbi:MAG TPA: hypothetical protein PKD53_05270 [Chloroflexaceae bacterium]|nr:hypothetical protein [Chloroflexaceae bacterium]
MYLPTQSLVAVPRADRPTAGGWLRASAAPLPATLALLWVVAATWLAYNAYLPVRIAAGDEVRQVLRDFQPIERTSEATFRWTTGYSQICLDQIGGIPHSIVRLSLLGSYAAPLGIESATLLANDQAIATLPLAGSNRSYHLLIHEALNTADDDCLILVSEVASPPGERRLVGVPFAELTLQPLRDAEPVRPALLQLLLNLALAGGELWLAPRLGVRRTWAAAGVIGATTLLLAALVGRWVEPGLGIARAMLPLLAGAALLGTGSVAAGRLRRRLAGHARALLIADLLGLAFWSAALLAVTLLFQRLMGVSGMWPMKAGLSPAPVALLAAPLALFVVWGALVLAAQAALEEPARVARAWRWAAVALVLGGAVALPVALKGSVRGWGSLFATFTDNPYEYISDVPRVGDDPLGFLRSYVAIAPGLSLHGSTHPPGNALLLWAVERVFGPGPVPASLVAIALSGALPLAALWLGWRLGGPALGLLAGAAAVVMPGHQIYSVTSMDGVFNGLLALGAVAFFLALEPGAPRRLAALAGLLIGAGLFFTYAATQLAFFGLGAAVVAIWRRRAAEGPGAPWWPAAAPVLRQGAIAAGVIAGGYLGLFLLAGYNVVEGAVTATATNAAVMRGLDGVAPGRAFAPPNLAYYTMHLVANLLPFAWYLGPAGLQAATGAGGRALRGRPWGPLAGLAVAAVALLGGMWLSGLFNREVERIWSFAGPLLAVLVAAHIVAGATPGERRWRAALFLGLLAAHAMGIRLLLNTYW